MRRQLKNKLFTNDNNFSGMMSVGIDIFCPSSSSIRLYIYLNLFAYLSCMVGFFLVGGLVFFYNSSLPQLNLESFGVNKYLL